MAKATFRFYEELNDHLPKRFKKVDIETESAGKKSIKEAIEDFEVPPSSIDLVLVNGNPVDFEHILMDGDRVSVYPVFEKLNIKNVSILRKSPLRRIRFIADVDLQDMVQSMRMLGFDVLYNARYSIPDIIEISLKQNRIILTRRKELLKSESVTHVVKVYAGSATEQVGRVLSDLDIKDRINLFTKCTRCNAQLENRQTKEILDRISIKTKRIFEKYLHCRSCRKDDRQNNTWQLKVDIIRL